jgi:ABC-type siderophore export system fused ATPase/permease subunit
VKARSAVLYTVLRLLAFLVPFGILMLFPVFRELYWLAAIFAALIGLSLSLLFLRRPLTEITTGIAQRRAEASAANVDEDVEDAATDAAALADEKRSPDA